MSEDYKLEQPEQCLTCRLSLFCLTFGEPKIVGDVPLDIGYIILFGNALPAVSLEKEALPYCLECYAKSENGNYRVRNVQRLVNVLIYGALIQTL